MSATHEDFGREVRRPGPSDRNFGLVISIALLVIGVVPLRRGHPVRVWSLLLGAVVLILTALRPALLHRANLIWTKIGLLLGKVLNPVVTALLFFLVFTPAATILRWMAKDLLGLRFDPTSESYWTQRVSGTSSGMVDQF